MTCQNLCSKKFHKFDHYQSFNQADFVGEDLRILRQYHRSKGSAVEENNLKGHDFVIILLDNWVIEFLTSFVL